MLRRFLPYIDSAREAEQRFGVDAWLTLAVMDRESMAGLTLRPIGPTGTGDWVPRKWEHYEHRGLRLKQLIELGEMLCMPIDGHGWGRGLMQLDYASPRFQAFLAKVLEGGIPAWQDPRENIHAGAEYLSSLIQTFSGNEGLACSAYNAGVGAVSRAANGLTLPVHSDRLQRAADSVTTGHNYGADVLARRTLLHEEWIAYQELQPKK